MSQKIEKKAAARKTLLKMYKQRHLYALLLPALLVVFFFSYCPMPGIVMAFQDFSIFRGLWGSEWVGLDNIRKIFSQSQFTTAIWNTLKVSMLDLVISFPAPIILALLINEIKNVKFKKFVQTASYLPHFLSWMAVIGMVQVIFGSQGLFNDIRLFFGATDRITPLAEQKNFIWFLSLLTLWKGVGWGTIVHLAGLAGINPELYEAAEVDGAKHLQKMWYITLPHMLPTCVILLIFRMGNVFGSNFQLVYGLQNPFIDFETISTIVYKTGIQNGNYSMASAIGFTEGIVSLILVVITNWVAKKITGSGIW